MNERPTITAHFSTLDDPRVDRTKHHHLQDILTIGICAVICAADNWVEIERFGKSKERWFKQFLSLPNGIPSHDTFGRVFAALDSETFMTCFSNWISAVGEVTKGSVVAIDGKTLRRSFDTGSEKAAIHMVSAWAEKNELVLGQLKTEEKSNEITAIPKLLDILDVTGCIVTIDAMGCQRKIAEKIVSGQADYVLAVTGNQGRLHDNITLFLDEGLSNEWQDISIQHKQTIEKDHGRIETRDYYLSADINWMPEARKWKGLSSIGMVRSQREIGEKRSIETRYYISTLNEVENFAYAVRRHWSIENSLHWVLDIAFREDESRVRKDHGAANLAILRHIAGLLKKD